MTSIRNLLQREIFTPKEERLLGIVHVWKGGKKKKNSILCAAVTSELPVQISLVKVKSDRGQYKQSTCWAMEDLMLVDGKDAVKDTAEFDFHLDKVYKWVASSPSEKIAFMTCMWKLNQRYLQNKVKFINISPDILQETQVLEAEVGTGEPAGEGYQQLTVKEAADIELLMERSELAVSDAQVFAQTLSTDLQVLDKANIMAIMESEKQVSQLVQLIDEGLMEVLCLENTLRVHDELLRSVKEQMDSIHKSNYWLQVIDNNQKKLQREVTYLADSLTLNDEHVWALNYGSLDTTEHVEACSIAAQALSRCANTSLAPEHRKLQGVAEQLIKFESLRQNFEKRFVSHLNKIIVLQGMDQGAAPHEDGADLVLPQHTAFHQQLLPYVSLMGWLRNSNPVIFNELYKVYADNLGKLYEKQMKDVFDLARFKVCGFKDSKRLGFQDSLDRATPSSSNLPRPRLRFSTTDRTEVDMARRVVVDKVLELVLTELEPVCIAEQEFLTSFFWLEEEENKQNLFAETTFNKRCSEAPGSYKSMYDELEAVSDPWVSGVLGSVELELRSLVSLCDKVYLFSCLYVLKRTSQHLAINQNTPCASFLNAVLNHTLQLGKRNFQQCIEILYQEIENAKLPKKVKIGILPFVTRLKDFVTLAENVLENTEGRGDVDKAYNKLFYAAFNSIENMALQTLKMPLNVVMMVNFHHIYTFLLEMKVPSLETTRKEAKEKYSQHLELFVTTYLGLPLEKLNEFFDGVKACVAHGIKEEEVHFQLAYSKQELRKVIEKYPGREVRKALEMLYRKINRQLSEENLLQQVVWRAMQEDFIRQYRVIEELIERCYPGSGISLEFTVEDLLQYFSAVTCCSPR
ncbi:exocyst complex component 1-like isoform X1 [Acipenser ruthenus]|uniref:exocyst complex component 1-like isoform X1 n=1 Tax=Acipenser ruthenus TaxID=7906 RepID=UPI00274051A6|nr:exocyst complex component 1-like isoform X1 [Acipenser ruthenus]XP_058845187.1 exocyst complex component 1-like isoform X1 [Acipenser ruthenus]